MYRARIEVVSSTGTPHVLYTATHNTAAMVRDAVIDLVGPRLTRCVRRVTVQRGEYENRTRWTTWHDHSVLIDSDPDVGVARYVEGAPTITAGPRGAIP